MMRQSAPEPESLVNLVNKLSYKPGWGFNLADIDRGQSSMGLTLVITISAPDTNNHKRMIHVNHYMIVPAASYNEQSWRRWLFEQILLVEQHEAAEFFRIGGAQPYAPIHAPGNDPYTIRELATDDERRTTYKGELVSMKSPDEL